MADQLEPVEQQFIADMAPYLDELRAGVDEARDFAGVNLEAKAAVDEVRDGSAEAGAALGGLRDHMAEDAAATSVLIEEMRSLRNDIIEADAAARAQGDTLAGLARQQLEAAAAAAVAAHEERKLRDDAAEAAGAEGVGGLAGAIMGLASNITGAVSGGMSSLGSWMGGIIGKALILIPLLVALAVPLAAVAGVAVAAGAGIGAFAVLAIPEVKKIAAALTETGKRGKKAFKDLDPAEQGIVTHIRALKGEFDHLAKAFEPAVTAAIGEALKFAPPLIHEIGKMATDAAPGVISLVGILGHGLVQTLKDIEPGIKLALPSFNKLVAAGISFINNVLSALAKPANMKDFVNAVDHIARGLQLAGPYAAAFIGFLAQQVPHVEQAWHFLARAVDAAREDAVTFGHSFEAVWNSFTHALNNVRHAFDNVRHFIADFAHNVAAHFDEVRHDIAHWVDDVRHDFDEVRHHIAAAASGAWHDVVRFFGDLVSGAKSKLGQLLSWVESLPGKIKAGLGDLGSLLTGAGHALIQGLLHGIQSAAGGLLSYVRGLAGDISHAFSSVLHIFSPSLVFFRHGWNLMAGVAAGVLAGLPLARAAMAHAATQLAVSPFGAAPGVRGGGFGTAVNVGPINVTAPAGGAPMSAAEKQGLQRAIQAAVLDYFTRNRGTGMVPAWWGG